MGGEGGRCGGSTDGGEMGGEEEKLEGKKYGLKKSENFFNPLFLLNE